MLLPATIRRVVLTGFMGAGKSTVGALLARSLSWQFLDSDAAIENRTGLTIAQIFTHQGESVFRSLEAATIEEITRQQHLVLAVGGGAVESAPVRDHLANLPDTCVIFLEAPLEIMIARCLAQPGATERPVLAAADRLPARLAARLPWYRQAHITIPTQDFPAAAVVEKILSDLHDRFAAPEAPASAAVETAQRNGKGTVAE
jgi:shikimate kinase